MLIVRPDVTRSPQSRPRTRRGNGIATFYEMALLQGISNEALALSLFVDGVASRLPVSFTLANVSQVCAVLVSQLSVFLTQI